ncbi:hypothetical protein BGZ60DRAFT_409692 [Tricladium varicosporioides]|nr:hypothetical protein BGZ60DRAFT_409692 [Hymenoscyphus varicosporioides]
MLTATFHPFSRLPLELRSRIWKLSANEPRVVTVRGIPAAGHLQMDHFVSLVPTPSVLQVCRESRFEALRFYTKAFTYGSSPCFIWTNFNVDTIKINDFRVCRLLARDAALIQQLVVESSDAELFNGYYAYHFSEMKGLKSILISSLQKVEEWGPEICVMESKFRDWFGGVEGWMCPEMKIIEKDTGVEMNMQNCEEILERRRERRSRERGGSGLRGRCPNRWEG